MTTLSLFVMTITYTVIFWLDKEIPFFGDETGGDEGQNSLTMCL